MLFLKKILIFTTIPCINQTSYYKLLRKKINLLYVCCNLCKRAKNISVQLSYLNVILTCYAVTCLTYFMCVAIGYTSFHIPDLNYIRAFVIIVLGRGNNFYFNAIFKQYVFATFVFNKMHSIWSHTQRMAHRCMLVRFAIELSIKTTAINYD